MLRITSQQGRQMLHGVRGVIFDLAGTLIDKGCQAPVHAMGAAFARNGLITTDEIIRADMGLPKRAHIRAILAKPAMLGQWECIFNNPPREIDIDRIYQSTNQELKRVITNYTNPTPCAVELLHYLQAQGIRIGITTGYSREIVDSMMPKINSAGIIYNNLVCADEVSNPRPKAGMINKILDSWEIYNFGKFQFIKVGDTVADIHEAHNGQINSCQVLDTCSDLGHITKSEIQVNRNRELFNSEREKVKRKFEEAGAEFYCYNLHDILTGFQKNNK
jgi:phosphonoacetaldehyde hydrolase